LKGQELSLPGHVAIIMDGNGRWAKNRSLPRAMGHTAGVEQVRTIVKMSSRIGISALTLYAFSTENWKRPKDEVGLLMKILIEYLKKEMRELHQEGVRFRSIGMRDGLPKEVVRAIEDAEELTRQNTGLQLTVAINYGARAEIINAAEQLARMYKEGEIDAPSAEAFEGLLLTHDLPDPDLVIRTSGESRLSNFLLYQAAYAELYFTDVLWPDFGEIEYQKALDEYKNRNRRYGAL
jgi:undecaprenyl diphosphate synthase